MSEERKTIIHYESPGTDEMSSDMHIMGTKEDILKAFVRIAVSIKNNMNFNIAKLSVMLPILVDLEQATIESSVTIDNNAIRKAKDGGGNG